MKKVEENTEYVIYAGSYKLYKTATKKCTQVINNLFNGYQWRIEYNSYYKCFMIISKIDRLLAFVDIKVANTSFVSNNIWTAYIIAYPNKDYSYSDVQKLDIRKYER